VKSSVRGGGLQRLNARPLAGLLHIEGLGRPDL
jgi:hypothetical protein